MSKENNKQNAKKPTNRILVVRLNDNPIPNICPLCDTETSPNIGAEIFLDDTDNIVCLECAEKHSPILAGLIAFAEVSRLFQTAENVFGEKWEKSHNFKGQSMNAYQDFGFETKGVNNASRN